MKLNIILENKNFQNLIMNKIKNKKNFQLTKEITTDSILIVDNENLISDKNTTILLSNNNIESKIAKVFHYKSPETINNLYDYLEQLHININTKILILDKDLDTLNKSKEALLTQLYQVYTSSNPLEALEIYEKQKDIKILITTKNLPLMSGCELSKIIRRNLSFTEFGIIGISDKLDADEFFNSGANDFLSKDLSYPELLHRVNNLGKTLNSFLQIKESANKDFLTGISNRKHFFELGQNIHLKSRNIALAMIDIDNFKKINDTFGHDKGDEVIKSLAHLLKNSIKGKDIVARVGGEEFIIFLQDIKTLDAINFLNEICKDISKLDFTVSIGLTTKKLNSLDEMIKQADKLLYKAKENGKNRVVSDMNIFV